MALFHFICDLEGNFKLLMIWKFLETWKLIWVYVVEIITV